MRTIIIMLGALMLLGCNTITTPSAQADRVADEQAVRQLVTDLENAWRTGDGSAFGAVFTDDADFMVWFGLYLQGRPRIAEAHQNIFDGIYAATEIEFNVTSVRFLGPDVALLRTEPRLHTAEQDDADTPPVAVPLVVAQRVGGDWKIATVQNTPYLLDVLETDPRLGDIRLFRELVGGHPGSESP